MLGSSFKCGVSEYALIGKGYFMELEGVETTIYCVNVPPYVSIDELETLAKMTLDRGEIKFEITCIIHNPVVEDDVDVEQTIFEMRHTIKEDDIDFTLEFVNITEIRLSPGYHKPTEV